MTDEQLGRIAWDAANCGTYQTWGRLHEGEQARWEAAGRAVREAMEAHFAEHGEEWLMRRRAAKLRAEAEAMRAEGRWTDACEIERCADKIEASASTIEAMKREGTQHAGRPAAAVVG